MPARITCPVPGGAGHRGRARRRRGAARRSPSTWASGVLLSLEGAGPCAAGLAIRCGSNRVLRDAGRATAPHARHGTGAGRAVAAGPSGRSTSPRPSASATPGATSRSPSELRKLHPDLEIDWLAQDPVTRGARGPRRADPSSQCAAGERVGATSSRSRPSTTCTCFQAIRRMDEILVANFMVFHDVVEREPLRPVDRRRGLGARLLPARESGAEDGRLLLAHRLRRLAPDARRWRARGVPDGRLQRRDDRAHRPLPAHPRPGDLRRQPRRHRARRRSGPGCRRSGSGRSGTSTSPAT